MSLVDNRTWYVLANFRENSLGSIRLGTRVEVYLLSYPNKRIDGPRAGCGMGALPGQRRESRWIAAS
jgi:multidrug efflux system membrane fusion protein